MKISIIIALFAVVALAQAAPTPVPAGKRIHSEAAAASIASYQDKATLAPKADLHKTDGAATMHKRDGSLVNVPVKKNKVCVKAPVNVDAKNLRILS
ncbi:hypothetical protein BGX23_004530 [Mortierella sp. AD031]|nr:hypothetical protein BGX23_004530 [Mortierella sp. AD031]